MQREAFEDFAGCFAEGMLLVQRDGRVLAANAAAASQLGVDAENPGASSLRELVTDPPQAVERLLSECTQGHGAAKLAFDVAGKGVSVVVQGSLLASTAAAAPLILLRLGDGQAPAALDGLSRRLEALDAEVTQLRRLQDTLDATEAGARAIVDTAVDAIVTIDERGIIQSANVVVESMFGYTVSELVGRNVNLLMTATDRDDHDNHLQRYLETGVKRIIGIGREIVARRKDGTLMPAELAVGEFFAGGERRFTGFIRDISDRKLMEERLRQREETLRVTLEQAPAGIVTMTLDGDILGVNRAFCRVLGRSETELVGCRLRDLCHADDVQACTDTATRLLRERVPSLEVGCRLNHRDGHSIVVRVYLAVVRDAFGDASSLIAQVVDRTEEVRSAEEAREHRERLAQASRVMIMGEMAAGIAHEINQPLAAIATYSQACRRMLEAGRHDATDLLDALSEVAAQAERAGEVIRRLRALVKQGEVRRTAVAINDVVTEAIELAHLDSRAPRAGVELDLEAALPSVEIDVVQIQQVLLNLIRNAVEATEGDSAEANRIGVRTRARAPDFVEVAVVDTGAGLSGEVADKLFEPFFTTKGSGMGMGLSISRSIIRAHGGRLGYTRNEGRGTTFWFTLPSMVEEKRAAAL